MSTKKGATLCMRVDPGELDIFKQKSQRLTSKPYQVLLREMINAFNEDRLTIKQPVGGIYVD